MTWRPQYRCSKFRHVFGKAATKENCFDGVPITRSVQDNNFCAVNPRFLAVITECGGGGAFLVFSLHHVSICVPCKTHCQTFFEQFFLKTYSCGVCFWRVQRTLLAAHVVHRGKRIITELPAGQTGYRFMFLHQTEMLFHERCHTDY